MHGPLPTEYPEGNYHVMSRGDGREDIFLDAADRERFLHLLGESVRNDGLAGACLLF